MTGPKEHTLMSSLLAVVLMCTFIHTSKASRLIVFGDSIADDGLGTSPLAKAALHTSEVLRLPCWSCPQVLWTNLGRVSCCY